MRILNLLLFCAFLFFACGNDTDNGNPTDPDPMEDPMDMDDDDSDDMDDDDMDDMDDDDDDMGDDDDMSDDDMDDDDMEEEPEGISGTVWLDANYDGLIDDNEQKVQGAMIKFYNADNGNLIGAVPTSNAGKFFLNPSVTINYYLELEMPSGGYVASTLENDNSITGENGKLTSSTFSTADGRFLNFGVYQGGVIGNLLWIDNGSDADVQDNADGGYKGATVNLYLVEESGEILYSSKTTDNNGTYLFTELQVGKYILEYVVDDAAISGFVMPNIGGDHKKDSDVVTTMSPSPNLVGRSDVIDMSDPSTDLSFDAGIKM